MEDSRNEVKYAGFWVRVLAAIIDGVILAIPINIIESLAGEDSWISIIFILFLWWWYSAKMLSSSWRATVGKKVLGLEVLDMESEQLTFKEASIRSLYSFVSYLFILPIFMMLFNDKKQTFHDYFGKTIVADKVTMAIQDSSLSNLKKEEKIGLKKIIRRVGIFIIVMLSAYSLYYFAMFAFVFGSLGMHKVQEYHESVQKYHTIDDKNDSKIIFYVEEFEKSGNEYLHANKVPEIFKARVKRKLALNCIGYFLKKHNDSTWLEQVQAVDRNQLNKYMKNTVIYDKRKNDKNWSFYNHYYFNEIYDEQEKIASSFDEEISKHSCGELQTSEEMFDRFLLPYIKTKENTLADDIEQKKHANYFGTLNKSFYRQSIKETKKLLEILYEGFPKIKQIKMEDQIDQDKKKEEYQKYFVKLEKEEKIRIQKEKTKALWKIEKGDYSGIDANIRNEKGQTPLMLAMQKEKYYFIDSLSSSIVDVRAKDNQGKTAFDYIKKPKNRQEAIFTNRAYESLRILEIKQIIRGRARIIEMYSNSRTDTINIKISGTSCDEFVFPTYTKCRTNN